MNTEFLDHLQEYTLSDPIWSFFRCNFSLLIGDYASGCGVGFLNNSKYDGPKWVTISLANTL